MAIPLVPYSKARDLIRQADLAALRKSGTLADEACATGGDYCHVGLLGWWLDRVMILELRGGHGGTCELFSRRVKEAGPGKWEVWRWEEPTGTRVVKRDEIRDHAIQGMIDVMGVKYAWHQILAMVPYHLPIIRHWLNWPTRDKAEEMLGKPRPWVCSTSVSRAWSKFAGVDPRLDIADRVTEPNDLTAPESIFKPQFRIGA